jgi:tetratricopeptide (TPR) repeat protein
VIISKESCHKEVVKKTPSKESAMLSMRKNILVILVGSSVLALSTLWAQDAKFAADSLQHGRPFTETSAEAERLGKTEAGELYEIEFDKAVRSRLGDIVSECAKNLGPKIKFIAHFNAPPASTTRLRGQRARVVFVFATDGHVEQVLTPSNQPVAKCIGDILRDLQLPAPPRASWPVELSIDMSRDNAAAAKAHANKLDLKIQKSPRQIILRNGEEIATWEGDPDSRMTLHYPDGGTQEVTIAKDQMHFGPVVRNAKSGSGAESTQPDDEKLAMEAQQAAAVKNYEEALKLYERAINLKGRFAPFVYHNRGMLYLHRAKASIEPESRIADLQRAIADFKTSIALGAASDDELNRGLEKVATRANLEEATKLLAQETNP